MDTYHVVCALQELNTTLKELVTETQDVRDTVKLVYESIDAIGTLIESDVVKALNR